MHRETSSNDIYLFRICHLLVDLRQPTFPSAVEGFVASRLKKAQGLRNIFLKLDPTMYVLSRFELVQFINLPEPWPDKY